MNSNVDCYWSAYYSYCYRESLCYFGVCNGSENSVVEFE